MARHDPIEAAASEGALANLPPPRRSARHSKSGKIYDPACPDLRTAVGLMAGAVGFAALASVK